MSWTRGLLAKVHGIPCVKELLDRIMAETETLTKGRLAGCFA